MTKVIGFDLDDTLVPETLFLKSGAYHISKWIHGRFPAIPEQRVLSAMLAAIMNRRNHYSALESILEEYDVLGKVDMKVIVEEFRRHLPDPSIYHLAPSIASTLAKLKDDSEIRLILITDGRSASQRNKIKAAGLESYFEEPDIYISEETGHDKSDPDSFLRVMERHAGASQFHYVGDNPQKDFVHPSRLGWITHQTHPFPLMIHPYGMPR